ncbi:MAG: rhombotail lipoprotein [Cocleimonas sp.]|jgi:rhombotail lipoprotein
MYIQIFKDKQIGNSCSFCSILNKLFYFSLILLLSGCSGVVSQHHGKQSHSSSLASFLYPNKQKKVLKAEKIPQLSLPVRIGIAFLPSRNWHSRALDTSNQYHLLNKVKSDFSKHQFIDDIKIIPSTYLGHHSFKSGSGFDTLDQVAKLHDVDVIALVSYDQLTQTRHNKASLLYWTIVGMYVIPGNENTIQTFVDTAVFDVRSRKMLMRAPGISKLRKRSTAIDVDSVMDQKALDGFYLAFDDMIANLDIELLQFKEKVKEGKSVKITNLNSYSAAGSLDLTIYFLLLVLLSIRAIIPLKRRPDKPKWFT